LRDLCLGITVIKGAHDAQLVSNFDRISLWKHSLGTAVGTKLIQERLTGSKAADLFVAGLLCNIGRLIPGPEFPQGVCEIVKLSREKNIRMLDAERKVLNVTHADIGAGRRQPGALTDTLVRVHQGPSGPSGNTNAAILNLAML
jgi:HD-like signal output (HDOD) protein